MTDLLDREVSLREIEDLLDAAVAGEGGIGLVTGRGGVGKTSLLKASVPIGEDRGMRILRARASELDRRLAFGVMRQLLEPAVFGLSGQEREVAFAGAADPAAPLFEGPADDSGEPEGSVLRALPWLVANLSRDQPLLLLIDDLQWTDEPTIRVLENLARRIDGLPVAMLITESPAAPDPPVELAALRADSRVRRIELKPLSRDHTDQFAVRTLGRNPGDRFLEAIWLATGGNPMLLDLVAREIRRRESQGDAGEGLDLAEWVAPGLVALVMRRLAVLGPTATRVAVAAAILDDRARFDDVTDLSGVEPEEAREAINGLVEAGALEGGEIRFVYRLVQMAVLESLPAAERDQLHQQAADLLRARGAAITEVALHLYKTTPAGDPETRRDLSLAARRAESQGAVSVAIDLLRRALAEGAQPVEETRDLLLDLGELELRTLAPEAVARMYEVIALDATAEQATRARTALGRILLLSDPSAALVEIEAARAGTSNPAADQHLKAAELECMLFVDALGARRDRRYREILSSSSLSQVELAHLAIHQALSGFPADQTLDTARAALHDDSLIGILGPGGPTWNLLAHVFRWVGAAAESRRLILGGETAVARSELRAATAFVEQAHTYWHQDFGKADDALFHAESGLLAIGRSNLAISNAALAAALAESLVRLDRAEEAAERAEPELTQAEGTFVEPFCLTARALVRQATGRGEAAQADLRRTIELEAERGWRSPLATRARSRLAEALLEEERTQEAIEVLEPDLEAAAGIGDQGALGVVLRVKAAAAGGRDRVALIEESVRLLSDTPLRFDLARAQSDLGSEHLAKGRERDARQAFHEALGLAAETGSVALTREIQAGLRAAGGRPRRISPRGVGALTPRERRTAELAARGLSNREVAEELYVTRKTVEFHLRNAYAKLGIGSRTQLAEAMNPAESP